MRKIHSEVEVNTTVNYSAKLHSNGDMEFDPCPHCGNEDLFNTQIQYGSQYCVDGRHDESLAPDDMGAERIVYISCGNMECGEVLYSE